MFEILKSYQRASRETGLADALTAIENGSKSGEIANSVFLSAKDTINRAIDDAIQVVHRKHIGGKWEILPDSVRKLSDFVGVCVYINLIPGRLKRITDFEAIHGVVKHPYRDEIVTLLQDIEPLSKIFDNLKYKVRKRAAKVADQTKTPGYHPPEVSSEAEKKVVALLESVTEKAYAELKSILVTQSTSYLKQYSERDNPHDSPYKFFVSSRPPYKMDHIGFHIVDALVELSPTKTWTIRKDSGKIITKTTTDTADSYRTFFVHKNFRKIASIVDEKGNLLRASAGNHSVSLSGLRGTFTFTFEDGSRFTVVNKVVSVTNSNNKHFYRFPLTFHDITLKNGKQMLRPSEKRMNTVFLGK